MVIETCSRPASENQSAAIKLGAEGATQPSREITVVGNTFRNDGDYPTVFVDNLTPTAAVLKGNHLSGTVIRKGEHTTVSFAADPGEVEEILAEVKRARNDADIVVISLPA